MAVLIEKQPDCASAWLSAVAAVDAMPGHDGHNIIIEIEHPDRGANLAHPVVATVDAFLSDRGKSVETISNTIFPLGLYRRYGYPEFVVRFREHVLPKVRRNDRWSGYYFDRMTGVPKADGGTFDQISDVVRRMSDGGNSCLNKFEIAIFDPTRDVDESPYGGQCLSFLSFKVLPGSPKRVALTAFYRNHFYVEKLLGNLIGLSRLMTFVAAESGLAIGPLIVHSTHAKIDTPGKPPLNRRVTVETLLADCAQAAADLAKAA